MSIWRKGPWDRTAHLWYQDEVNDWQWRRECRRAKQWTADWASEGSLKPADGWKRCAKCERKENNE